MDKNQKLFLAAAVGAVAIAFSRINRKLNTMVEGQELLGNAVVAYFDWQLQKDYDEEFVQIIENNDLD